MLSQFEVFLTETFKITKESKLLLTVSGGVDSSVMSYLFARGHYLFDIAHCNFHLRGKESDEDEAFVRKMAEQYHCRIHVINFETAAYAKAHKMGIEEAARTLR